MKLSERIIKFSKSFRPRQKKAILWMMDNPDKSASSYPNKQDRNYLDFILNECPLYGTNNCIFLVRVNYIFEYFKKRPKSALYFQINPNTVELIWGPERFKLNRYDWQALGLGPEKTSRPTSLDFYEKELKMSFHKNLKRLNFFRSLTKDQILQFSKLPEFQTFQSICSDIQVKLDRISEESF